MDSQSKKQIGLPLLALGFSLIPFILTFISSIGWVSFSSPALLFIVLSPIAGLAAGVISLNRGKARIGLTGKIIAITAVALPLSLVALILIFFIGAATGIISLM